MQRSERALAEREVGVEERLEALATPELGRAVALGVRAPNLVLVNHELQANTK